MRTLLLASALGCALTLTACGIRGPLFLPQVPEAPARDAPSSSTDHSKQPGTESA
ncbi:LPS translocon maturation chaperone LptM [Rhodocyclaceae bacterium SMB388]